MQLRYSASFIVTVIILAQIIAGEVLHFCPFSRPVKVGLIQNKVKFISYFVVMLTTFSSHIFFQDIIVIAWTP